MDSEYEYYDWIGIISLVLIGGIILAFWALEPFASNNKKTIYNVECRGDIRGGKCLGTFSPLSIISYKVNSSEKKVIANVKGQLFTYDNCEIFDKKSWECMFINGDRHGLREGNYFYYVSETQKQADFVVSMKQVPKLSYYVLKWLKTDDHIGNDMPNAQN